MKKFWDRFSSWEEADKEWEKREKESAEHYQVRKLTSLPKGPTIVSGQDQFLRCKGLYWLLTSKGWWRFWYQLFFHPFSSFRRYLCSLRAPCSYTQDGDFFLYGINTVEEAERLLQDKETVLFVGFSYCQKPFECPFGRFSKKCNADLESRICRQCLIGKTYHTLPEERTFFSIIPTASDIALAMIEAKKRYPNKKVLFLITACEMALKMFGDFAPAIGVQGIGVRLSGRICNTLWAFTLSERGIKPGLTQLSEQSEERFFSLLRKWREGQGT